MLPIAMSNEKTFRRRNISWLKSTDEIAEMLALDRKMKVSQLLEQLVFQETKNHRVKPGEKSVLFEALDGWIFSRLDQIQKEQDTLRKDAKSAFRNPPRNARADSPKIAPISLPKEMKKEKAS